jgi:hypothetical protein
MRPWLVVVVLVAVLVPGRRVVRPELVACVAGDTGGVAGLPGWSEGGCSASVIQRNLIHIDIRIRAISRSGKIRFNSDLVEDLRNIGSRSSNGMPIPVS